MIKLFAPIFQVVLGAGIPLGPNGLITIPGRKSGLPRTTGVAIIEVAGRRWVWCPWGEAQWVQNLRASGRATISFRRKSEDVIATELDPEQRLAFHRDFFGPRTRKIRFGRTFIRMVDGVDVNHPEDSVEGRPAFELHPAR